MGLHHWHQSMETGFPMIDEYHRKLAEYLADLENAIAEKNRPFIGAMIDQIIDHLESTFPYEEELMRQHQYPMCDDHLRVHESFLNRLRNYGERHENGEDISRKLTYDLKIWLTNHIQLQDGDYARFITNKERSKGPFGWFRRFKK
jgi:hemerythrin-like metal-binding protein